MIKRISFVTKKAEGSLDAFATAWSRLLARGADVPPEVRPSRAAVCTTLADITGPEAKHDGIALEWFTDGDHLQRYQAWRESPDGRAVVLELDGVVDVDGVVVADELVLRGPDWLDQRWSGGGVKFKHMALALRASDLTPAQFSDRWKNRAGQIRRPGAAEMTVIPDDARGHAYVQNHPRPRDTGDWLYDAVNEVYFDEVDGLRRRIDWFQANLDDGTEEDLVREASFVAVCEEVLFT